MGTDTCIFAGDFFLLVMGEVLYACGRACELKMGEKESGRVSVCANVEVEISAFVGLCQSRESKLSNE